MVDFGTLITDSRGILHDISKDAFDSFQGGIKTNGGDLLENFSGAFEGFKTKITEKYGIDASQGLSLESLQKQLIDVGGKVAFDGLTSMGLKLAVDLEGPLGIIVSEGLSILYSELSFAMSSDVEYKVGQWVFLDCGMRTRMINAIPKVIQLGQSYNIMGNAEIPDDLDYTSEAKHAIGFVLQRETSGYEWSVFSFLSGREEKMHQDKIRPCPEAFANKLDNDMDFSNVRKALFLKEHDPTLKSYIPTNPGETVYYKGTPHFVVSQAGDEWVIRSADGVTVRCTEQDLLAGKTLTSQKWRTDSVHLGSYRQDGFFSGEWVWIPAGKFVEELTQSRQRRLAAVPPALATMQADNRILGLVKTIQGQRLDVVRAYDGKELVEPWRDILPASDSVQGLLNRDKYCGPWRSRVLEGANPTQVTPGEYRPMLTLGLGEVSSEELQKIEEPDVPRLDPSKVVGVERSNVTSALEHRQIALDDLLDERLELDNVRMIGQIEQPPEKARSSSPGTGSLMLVVGAAVLWAVFIKS